MRLLVDIGNTRAKLAVADQAGRIEQVSVAERLERALVEEHVGRYAVQSAILSSTRGDTASEESLLREAGLAVIRFDHTTSLPIEIDYRTPHTLGLDRVAAAVGASVRYPGRNCLVVDLGTAMTLDLVTADGVFRGGAISLGYSNRLRALNEYTATLPLLEPIEGACADFPLQGKSTQEAIEWGVFHSILFEIEGYMTRLSADFANLCVIVTGGEAKYFEKRIKNAIFAEPNLVFCGLNRILEHNLAKDATTKK